MTRFGRAAISAAGILVALILVGVAAAGNGNGNGNGNGTGNGNGGSSADHAVSVDSAAQAPGKSADAPGQVKKNAPSAPQSAPVATTPAPAATVAQPPAAPAASSPADPGVKPSNSTSKNTSCVTGRGAGGNTTCTGGSKADSSKQYGNGTTASQIATSRGGNGVTLEGPGNSQPHKVVACGRRHAVDVHAVKHYNANGCAETPTPTPTPTPNPTPNPSPNPTPNPSPNPTPGAPGNPSSNPSPHGHISGGQIDPPVRVLGDPARHTHKRSSKPASAVLSEVAAAVPVLHGTLPFTGFPLWALVLVAVGLIAIGVALRTPGALTRVHAHRRTHRRGSGAA